MSFEDHKKTEDAHTRERALCLCNPLPGGRMIHYKDDCPEVRRAAMEREKAARRFRSGW